MTARMFPEGSFPHCTISIIKMENQKLSPGTTAGALVIPIGNFIIVFPSHYTDEL